MKEKNNSFQNNPETNKNLDDQKVAKTPNFEIKIKKLKKLILKMISQN